MKKGRTITKNNREKDRKEKKVHVHVGTPEDGKGEIGFGAEQRRIRRGIGGGAIAMAKFRRFLDTRALQQLRIRGDA